MDNYSLLMERFPGIALALPYLGGRPRKRELLTFSAGSAEIIYFYGLGSLEGYLYFAGWLADDLKRCLIFLLENAEEVAAALSNPELEALLQHPRIHLLLPEEIDPFIAEVPSSKIEIFSLPSKEGPFFEELKERILRKALLSWSRHTDQLHGYQLFENFLQNLSHLPTSFYANGLKGRFAGVPAIVCGAGPSLQSAIPFLKNIEEQALIIGGGSTLAALSAQGITPHFGLMVDPNEEEVRRLKNSFAFEVPLLYATRLFFATFQTCNGPFGYMRSGIGGLLELWLEEALGLQGALIGEGLDEEALSVTAISLAWAQFLGCNPIFLAGVDLAYTDKARYAPGIALAPLLSSGEIGSDRKLMKMSHQGQQVQTAIRWTMESASLSRFASKHPETSFFNLSKEGLGFHTIPYLSLDEGERMLPAKRNLREEVIQAVLQSPMPPATAEIVKEKVAELSASLKRAIASLEILAGQHKGSLALAALELREEIAYALLFFDAERVLQREQQLQGMAQPADVWCEFLALARKYELVLSEIRR